MATNFRHCVNVSTLTELTELKPEIRKRVEPNGFITFCYMIAEQDTFNGMPARECRGITFDSNGNLAGLPLHKFFNVGEREETQEHNLKWDQVTAVFEKIDGSLIHTVNDNGNLLLKSKKTFDSAVAVAATQWLNERPILKRHITDIVNDGLTLIFEWVSPEHRIVIRHPEQKLILLHVRNHETGHYADPNSLAALARVIGLEYRPVVTEFHVDGVFDYTLMKNALETRKDIEGWVIQFNNHEMVKAKTKWYLDLHHAITFVRERDIAKMVANETVDDYKSFLSSNGESIEPVLAIEHQVVTMLTYIEKEIREIVEADKELSRKDFAIKHKKHQRFGLLMSAYLGQDIDLKDYFMKNLIQEFSLEVVDITPVVTDTE